MLKVCLKTAAFGVWCTCSIYVVRKNFFEIVQLNGSSMEPTLHEGDCVIARRIVPASVKHEDLVLLRTPFESKGHVVKRVKALPGDKIRHTLTSTEIPMGHMWVEGDNRNNSKDSRTYGPVPQGLVEGRLVYRILPLSSMGPLR